MHLRLGKQAGIEKKGPVKHGRAFRISEQEVEDEQPVLVSIFFSYGLVLVQKQECGIQSPS